MSGKCNKSLVSGSQPSRRAQGASQQGFSVRQPYRLYTTLSTASVLILAAFATTTFSPPSAHACYSGDTGDNTISCDSDTSYSSIYGYDGNDTFSIKNGSSVEMVDGGTGNDAISVSDTSVITTLSSGDGSDSVNMSGGAVFFLDGGDGDDTIILNQGTVGHLLGGNGSDRIEITGSTVNMDLSGGNGNDIISITDSTVSLGIGGGAGADTITLNSGSIGMALTGGSGADTLAIYGGSVANGVFGGSGNDSITVTNGTVSATDGVAISGGGGDDVIIITGGNVNGNVVGGSGTDSVSITGGSFSGSLISAETILFVGDGEDQALVQNGTTSQPEVIQLHSTGSITLRDIDSGDSYTEAENDRGSAGLFTGGADISIENSNIRIANTSQGTNVVGSLLVDSSSALFASNGDVRIRGTAGNQATVILDGGGLSMLDGGAAKFIDSASTEAAPAGSGKKQTAIAATTTTITIDGRLALRNADLGFDFNGTTGIADQVIANQILALGKTDIYINKYGRDPVSRGIAPLITARGSATPTLPTSANDVTLASNYKFGRTGGITTGDPSDAGTTYKLLQNNTNDGQQVYLVFFPTASGPVEAQSPSQLATATTDVRSVEMLGTDIIDTSGASGTGSSGGGGGPNVHQISPVFGMFASGRLGTSQHDGFSYRSGGISGKTASFDTKSASVMATGQFDLAKWADIDGIGLKAGFFGGYAHTDIDLGNVPGTQRNAGNGQNESSMAGGFGLIQIGNLYGVMLGSGSWGESEVANNSILAKSEYDTSGYVFGGIGGYVFPVKTGDYRKFGDNINLDIRGGLSYARNIGDAHSDSLGNTVGEAKLSMVKGLVSATLSTSFEAMGNIIVPKLQGGIERRFNDENSVISNGGKVVFQDSDQNYFASIGLSTYPNQSLELFSNVRVDLNKDQKALSSKIGAKFKLN